MTDLTVTDQPSSSRFEATTPEGEVAGFAEYTFDGPVITFTHTVVDPAHEGKGVGGALVRSALDEVRGRGLRVIAQCPFVRGWIDKHPDYADLLV
ncbi:MAG: acetyltransferase-like protein [Frankiales bacterium]|nr:acetyltransferase-like protein [Frankiales bacterium]